MAFQKGSIDLALMNQLNVDTPDKDRKNKDSSLGAQHPHAFLSVSQNKFTWEISLVFCLCMHVPFTVA